MPGRLLHYQHSAHIDAALCAALVRPCGADTLPRLSCCFCLCSQAEGSWSKERCCAVQRNRCYSDSCYDEASSSDYLYRLSPGEPERYEPIGPVYHGGTLKHPTYQYVYSTTSTLPAGYTTPDYWPIFGGGNDLTIGDNGQLGAIGRCDQGDTYRGSPNAACGGGWDAAHSKCEGLGCWGHTDLEVWFPSSS